MPPTPTAATTGAVVAAASAEQAAFRLVGHRNFVRVNPRSDRFHTFAFHHVELWCADAASAAGRFSFGLGAPLAARSDLSTGNTAHASLLLRSGALAFLFTAPYAHGADAATASLPSFSAADARRFAVDHGLAVRAVALRVADAEDAFRDAARGIGDGDAGQEQWQRCVRDGGVGRPTFFYRSDASEWAGCERVGRTVRLD